MAVIVFRGHENHFLSLKQKSPFRQAGGFPVGWHTCEATISEAVDVCHSILAESVGNFTASSERLPGKQPQGEQE